MKSKFSSVLKKKNGAAVYDEQAWYNIMLIKIINWINFLAFIDRRLLDWSFKSFVDSIAIRVVKKKAWNLGYGCPKNNFYRHNVWQYYITVATETKKILKTIFDDLLVLANQTYFRPNMELMWCFTLNT